MPRSKSVRAGELLRRMTKDLSLNQAFQLAHSIYRHKESDRRIALEIVWEAVQAVEVRLSAQHEADRHDPQRPTKVRWTTLQWFQLLIYCKSEKYEQRQECESNSLTEEDMIVRYIKHLILTTSRRNSFHISLGLSRLLYDYSATETMAIYDLVFQDPDSSTRKADAYYRARKNKLIEELEKRFHQFVQIYEGPRREKKFQPHEDSGRFFELVFQYLNRFTPWETHCELPKQLDTWVAVRSLQSSQTSQIHSLIHPLCFSKITAALSLDPPESRLQLPRFFLSQGDNPTPMDSSPSDLTEEETSAIREKITEEASRRRKFTPRSMSVLADGIERARLDPRQSRLIRFDVENDVTLIELVGHNEGGELLLAAHVLSYEEDVTFMAQSEKCSVMLEGGQEISLVRLPTQAGLKTASRSFEITYRETNPLRAVALWWRQFSHQLSEKSAGNVPVFIPKVALAAVTLIAAAFILYVILNSWSLKPDQIAKQQPTLQPDEKKFPTPGATSSPELKAKSRGQRGHRQPETSPGPPPGSGVTREQSTGAVTTLLNVERLYVASMGEDAFSRSVQQQVIEKLQAANHSAVGNSPDEADTAVIGLARLEGKRKEQITGQEIEVGNVALKLVNVSGDVVWRARKLRGTAEEIATAFTRELLAAIKRERRTQRK